MKGKRSKKIIRIKPENLDYYEIADQCYKDGDLEGAVHYFYMAQAMGDFDALISLGETYADLGEPEEALKYLFRALDQEPDDTDLCHSIASCFIDLDDEDTAFYYFTPRMTISRFKYIMEETERLEQERVKVRMVEKNDDLRVTIALKLLSSGDNEYAREMLLTVKPESEHYAAANNLLALSYLEEENAEKALAHAQKALEIKENIDSRCNMLMAYHIKKDEKRVEELIGYIEKKRLDINGHKTAALAFTRLGDAERAAKHLRVLVDAAPANRDALVSYALALYNKGEAETAKDYIIKASRLYPEDVAIGQFAMEMARGEKLDLFPVLGDATGDAWINEIDKTLAEIAGSGKNRFDKPFREKISWLFQTRSSWQVRAAAVLCRFESWIPFFRDRLLDPDLDLVFKRACLHSLMFYGGKSKYFRSIGTLGLVIDGLYARLKIEYPAEMNEVFYAAYCHAFASFAFSDSDFEDRMNAATKKLIKKYYTPAFDHSKITSDSALAAVIFLATTHGKISEKKACCHIFDCDEAVLDEYLTLFGIKKKSKAKITKGAKSTKNKESKEEGQ